MESASRAQGQTAVSGRDGGVKRKRSPVSNKPKEPQT